MASPTVTTQTCEQVYGATAQGRGNITSTGGESISAHGHCWDTSTNPTTSNDSVDNGAGDVGAFKSSLTDLIPGTGYYTRAYAINPAGTSYGDNVYFTASTERAGYIWMEGQHFHGFNENAVEILLEDWDNPRILNYIGM